MSDERFDPKRHMRSLKGSEYLDVKWRLVWFRQECPQGTIETELIAHVDTFAMFRATVQDGKGAKATAHGSETRQDFGDYVEKAETKAVGRALAYLGYGTQFAPDLTEGERIVDSPVETAGKAAMATKPGARPAGIGSHSTPSRTSSPAPASGPATPAAQPVSGQSVDEVRKGLMQQWDALQALADTLRMTVTRWPEGSSVSQVKAHLAAEYARLEDAAALMDLAPAATTKGA